MKKSLLFLALLSSFLCSLQAVVVDVSGIEPAVLLRGFYLWTKVYDLDEPESKKFELWARMHAEEWKYFSDELITELLEENPVVELFNNVPIGIDFGHEGLNDGAICTCPFNQIYGLGEGEKVIEYLRLLLGNLELLEE